MYSYTVHIWNGLTQNEKPKTEPLKGGKDEEYGPFDTMSLSVSPTLSFQQPEKNETDIHRMLLKQGRCPNCRIYTHEHRGLRLVPLTNTDVYKGRCLVCHPMKIEAANLSLVNGSAEQARIIRTRTTRGRPFPGSFA